MAKLTAADRKALPASDFAGPDRSYPMPDRAHAADAKARVANKSPALKAKVDAKADKILKARSGTAMVDGPAKGGMSKVPKGPIDKKTLGSMVESLRK